MAAVRCAVLAVGLFVAMAQNPMPRHDLPARSGPDPVCQCDTSNQTDGLHVDCSNRGCTEVPPLPSAAVYVDLSGNSIPLLDNDTFVNVPTLVYLDLSNNSLETIKEGAFRGLRELVYLNLSRNDNMPLTSRTVGPAVFADLTSLRELRLFDTTSASLPDDYPSAALARLTGLTSLWLDGRMDKQFGEEMANLTQLTRIAFPGDLAGFGICIMPTIDKQFRFLTSLVHLSIVECRVTSIAESAFSSLHNLEVLDLSNNRFVTFGNLTRSLCSLSNTNIHTLYLNNVVHDVDCNTIIEASDFDCLSRTSLRKLYIENNRISLAVNQQPLEDLAGLELLSLKNNVLELAWYALYTYKMTNLKELYISYQFYRDLWDVHSSDKVALSNSYPKPSAISTSRSNAVHLHASGLQSAYTYADRSIADPLTVCPRLPFAVPPIIPFLSPHIEFLDSSFNKLDHSLFNITIDHNYSLRKINASHSGLYCWEGPIYGLHALHILDLSNNLCSRVGPNFFDEFGNLTELIISKNFLGKDVKDDVNGQIMKNLQLLEHLDMSLNRLEAMPPAFLQAQVNLKTLRLGSNVLSAFDVEVGHMTGLQLLDLSDNGISTISPQERSKLEAAASQSPLTVDLSKNFVHCYCEHIDVLRWIESSQDTQLTIIIDRCFDENEDEKPIGTRLELDSLIGRLEAECRSPVAVIVAASVGAGVVTNLLVAVLVYRYRWKLRYWYYVSRHHYRRGTYQRLRGHRSPADTGDSYKFDVFVICSADDADSSCVNEMYKHLEEEKHLKLIESERDFFSNTPFSKSICSAINQSRVSVFVLTQEWLAEDDAWWRFAVRMCNEEALHRGHRVHFSIFVDGTPADMQNNKAWRDIAEILNTKDNMDFPAVEASRQAFWGDCHITITKIADRSEQ